MAMTHEEAAAKLVTLNAEAEALAVKYNEVFGEGKIAEANRISAELDEKIAEYTRIARTDCFNHCAEAENPMMEAINLLSFVTIAKKDDKDNDTGTVTRKIEKRSKRIDLAGLHKYVEGGIGVDKTWIYQVEQLNLQMTMRLARDLAKDKKEADAAIAKIKETYPLSNAAKDINLGKDPASNTQIEKTLNAIVTAMLGEGYKVRTCDVRKLVSTYAREGKTVGVVIASKHKALRNSIADLCHMITHADKSYEVLHEKMKEQK